MEFFAFDSWNKQECIPFVKMPKEDTWCTRRKCIKTIRKKIVGNTRNELKFWRTGMNDGEGFDYQTFLQTDTRYWFPTLIGDFKKEEEQLYISRLVSPSHSSGKS